MSQQDPLLQNHKHKEEAFTTQSFSKNLMNNPKIW